MDDEFKDHIGIWDSLGVADPFWAVLSDPARRYGKWDVDEFYATGREHMSGLVRRLEDLGIQVSGRTVVDFGCGLGRLSQGLALHGADVIGIDASVGMIVGAQRHNAFPDRCAFLLNRAPDLSLLGDESVDGVVSFIALQHIPPPAALDYLRDFCRILRPGGFLAVQVPDCLKVAATPDGIHIASIEILEAPVVVGGGQKFDVRVGLTNASTAHWDSFAPGTLRAGNHWVLEDGSMSVTDDGRSDVSPIGPGESTAVTIACTAPAVDGRYVLEIDLVEEGVTWFEAAGGTTARLGLEVRGAGTDALEDTGSSVAGTEGDDPGDGPVPEEPPGFGMFPIPSEVVRATLDELGLDLLNADPDGSAGPAWRSFTYLARKPAPA